MTEPLLLAATQVSTFEGERLLTNASAFFFRRDERLFLVTSGHVVHEPITAHAPDSVSFEVHLDRVDLTKSTSFRIPLYVDGVAVYRQAEDSGGPIDVAVIPLDEGLLEAESVFEAFTPEHLQPSLHDIEVGGSLLIVGFPLGFHDVVHHLPVVRQATIASSFGVRFQGQGYFLTDARTHRGTSGAPVVMRALPGATPAPLPWRLLGVHSARMDMGSRDRELDESLGLNCAWYADVLLALTRG